MADEAAEPAGGSRALFALLLLGVAALGALLLYLKSGADGTAEALEFAKDDYRRMTDMRRSIEALKPKADRAVAPGTSEGDPLQFLSQKARQAQIPSNLFTVTRNQELTSGRWEETPYTIQLRASKEAPVARAPVVDFLRLVEEQRPSMKSKNLTLAFEGDAFSSVTITFSSFQRKPAGASSDR